MAEDKKGDSEKVSAVYVDLINKSLIDERSYTATLEARAQAVITTSGILASLLIGFLAFVPAGTAFRKNSLELLLLLIAIVLFALAAVLALAINVRAFYIVEVSPESLKRLLEPTLWKASDWDEAALNVAEVTIRLLTGVRQSNWITARQVRFSVVAETAAVICLTITVVVRLAELASRP